MATIQNHDHKEDAVITALGRIKSYFLYAALFSALVNLLMLTPIIYMLQVYDRVVSSGSMSTLGMLTLLMVLLMASSGGFEWLRTKLLVAANVRLEKDLRDTVSKAAFKQALVTGNPNAANLAMNDLLSLRQFATGNGIFAFLDAPWAPIYIGVMYMFHPLFGIAATIAAVIMVMFAVATQKMTAKKLENANFLTRKASVSFLSNLRNAEVIQGMGMASNIRSKDDVLYDAATNEQAVASTAAGRLAAVSKSFRIIAQSLMLGLGAYLALNQQISPGMMIAGSLLLGRALAPIDLMVATWKGFVEAKAQFFRLRDRLDAFPQEEERMSLPPPTGNLSVENVIVTPPGSSVICVKAVSFQLNAGEALGLIGPSAAGKTSLARAILGIWSIASGTVRLDGADIDQFDRDMLGPHLGYLPQDIELFDGSIAENICRFSDPDSDSIIEASKTACIHDMILRLPEGYETQITSTSGALSAGQRQRVGLARALYGKPRLIILDEPNSNLDEQGERELLVALRQMKEAGSAVIVISHRTSILALADKLLLMAEGSVAKFGPRDEVLSAIKAANANVSQLQQNV